MKIKLPFTTKKNAKKRLNNQELLNFFDPLGILIHSGISAFESLQILKEESENKESQELLNGLISHMEQYGRLSEALKDSGCFPVSATAYIEVGEETGCLDEVLQTLSQRYEQELSVSAQIRSAVSYPLFMLGMVGIVILLLLIKVLPVFQQVFRQMGMELNGWSAALLNIGTAIQKYMIFFALLFAVMLVFVLVLFMTKKGQKLFQRTLLKVPFLYKIPLALDYAHLTQAMELGLRSGLGLDEGLRMSKMLLSHPDVLTSLDKTIQLLEEGFMFTDAIMESHLFSGLDSRMIHVGFRTGTMEEVLHRFSKRSSEEAVALIEKVVSILEPTIVIIMSLLVGFVLLSVMLPLLGIMSGVMA